MEGTEYEAADDCGLETKEIEYQRKIELLCTLNLTVTWCDCISTQISYQCFFLTTESFHLLLYKLVLFSSPNSPSLFFFSPLHLFNPHLCHPFLSNFFLNVLLNFPPLLFQLSNFVSFPPPISFLFLSPYKICLLSYSLLSSALISSPLLSHCYIVIGAGSLKTSGSVCVRLTGRPVGFY